MRYSERRGRNCRRCREISVFSGIIIMVFCWWVPSAALTFNSFQMTAPWAKVYEIWCLKEKEDSRKMATTWILPVSFEMNVCEGVRWPGPAPSLSSPAGCVVQPKVFMGGSWLWVTSGVQCWWQRVVVWIPWSLLTAPFAVAEGDTTYSSFLLRAPPPLDLSSPAVVCSDSGCCIESSECSWWCGWRGDQQNHHHLQ